MGLLKEKAVNRARHYSINNSKVKLEPPTFKELLELTRNLAESKRQFNGNTESSLDATGEKEIKFGNSNRKSVL